MDVLLSQTEEDLGLKDYWDTEPSSVMSISPTEEEVNSLLGVQSLDNRTDPTPSASIELWTGNGQTQNQAAAVESVMDSPACLKEKLEEMEKQRKEEKKSWIP